MYVPTVAGFDALSVLRVVKYVHIIACIIVAG